jgi:hypothetical protein
VPEWDGAATVVAWLDMDTKLEVSGRGTIISPLIMMGKVVVVEEDEGDEEKTTDVEEEAAAAVTTDVVSIQCCMAANTGRSVTPTTRNSMREPDKHTQAQNDTT